MKETVYKCDRCGTRDERRGGVTTRNFRDDAMTDYDLCGSCNDALLKWLQKDNATTPGGRGPDWEEVCHHHVPCGGPCADPHWRKVR